MAIFKQIQEAFQFVLEGASRIFSPDKNVYPKTGVQPFEGDPYDEKKEVD